jgi:hypothetical protein
MKSAPRIYRSSRKLFPPSSDEGVAKREVQVTAMVDSTVGMVGDLHGIMGQAMPEISAIDDPPMIEGKVA